MIWCSLIQSQKSQGKPFSSRRPKQRVLVITCLKRRGIKLVIPPTLPMSQFITALLIFGLKKAPLLAVIISEALCLSVCVCWMCTCCDARRSAATWLRLTWMLLNTEPRVFRHSQHPKLSRKWEESLNGRWIRKGPWIHWHWARYTLESHLKAMKILI